MRPVLLVLLLGCSPPPTGDDTGDTDSGDTGDTDTADTSDTSDTEDTEDTGTDEDHDGWSIERGDCDDASVWVNPGWAERQDDLDNDCDGLVDERLDAIVAFQVDTNGAQTSRVHRIDLLGELDGTWDLAASPAEDVDARWIADRPGDAGWWLVDSTHAVLYDLSPAGVATVVWDAGNDATLDPPVMGLYGAASMPDGSALVSTGDRLFTVTPAGVATQIASWSILDVWGMALAVDPRDGSVAMFGAAGGLANWSPADGLTILQLDDGFAPQALILDAVADEEGHVYALGDALVAGSPVRGVFEWDRQGTAYVVAVPWEDSTGDAIDFAPVGLAMDTEGDDFYVTANGGWFRTVWRMFPDEGYGSLLWPDAATLGQVPPPEDEHRFVTGVGIRWAHD